MDELREKIAEATYHFVHRGKTHLDWDELPYKWGKKSYYEFADQILALIQQAGYVKLADDQSYPLAVSCPVPLLQDVLRVPRQNARGGNDGTPKRL